MIFSLPSPSLAASPHPVPTLLPHSFSPTYLHSSSLLPFPSPFLLNSSLPSSTHHCPPQLIAFSSPPQLSPPLPSSTQPTPPLLNSAHPSPPQLSPPLPSSTQPTPPLLNSPFPSHPPPPFPPIQSPEKRRRLSSESPLSGSIRHVSGGLYLTSILPEELLLHIFSFLRESDLCQASLVCKKFARFASDRKLWRDLFLRTFGVSRAYVHPKRNPELVKVDVTTLSWKEQFSVMVSFTYSTYLR